MDLAAVRKAKGQSQEECAPLWGLKHKGSVSAIETGAEQPSLEAAMRIQIWSAGEVRVEELRPDLADLLSRFIATARTPEEVAA